MTHERGNEKLADQLSEEEESGVGGLRRVELPRSPKGSLEVCGQRFKVTPASTCVLCTSSKQLLRGRRAVGPEDGELG